MAKPSEKLATALEALHAIQAQGQAAIRSKDLTRTQRERLVRSGFIQEVIKGWYIPARPDETAGESTAWYAAFWGFCAEYLTARFGDNWCLSPEQSLLLHAGNWNVPRQLLLRAKGGRNRVTPLPFGTSVLDVNLALPERKNIEKLSDLRVYALEAALVASSANVFTAYPTEARTALAVLRDASGLLARLLEGGHSVVAGRIAGALRNIGRDHLADEILKAMRAANYTVREADPFERKLALAALAREPSPYVHRIRLMWEQMRGVIPVNFPAPGKRNDIEAYLREVDDIYVTDAYHSLSIEGYRVNPELIERVRGGTWNPDSNKADREHRDALAARGYWQAFQVVKKSVRRALGGENPGLVADDDHGAWYRELFAPSVTAGLLKPADLAGYRSGPVFIRRSKHVPLNADAVRDAMPAFFDLLQNEQEASVRIVLGHFIFVYIHPHFDGNGRMGRFLMNVMMAGGGYNWTVIPIERREDYMAALESASIDQDIKPFTLFLADLVRGSGTRRTKKRD